MTRPARNLDRRMLLKAGSLAAIGSLTGRVTETETTTDESADWESLSLDEQLDIVRESTQPYTRVTGLRDTNYKSIALPLLCEGGFHFDNEALYDSEVDPRNPESLFYLLTDDGQLRLGGAEYLVITERDDDGNPADPKPDLFNDEAAAGTETETSTEETLLQTSEEDGWELIDDPVGGLIWDLHVWVHEENPDGVFAHRNPRFADMPSCVTYEEFYGDS